MKKITIVASIHKENGAADAEYLKGILELVEPEVIFLELNSKDFENVYIRKQWNNLESDAIAKYLLRSKVELVPVDQTEAIESIYQRSSELFSVLDSHSTPELQLKYNQHMFRVTTTGFDYLNSNDYCLAQSELDRQESLIIKNLNNSKIAETYAWWTETQTKREKEMLRNIYEHCAGSSLKNAAFLVGAAHVSKIKDLIMNDKKPDDVQWVYYQGK